MALNRLSILTADTVADLDNAQVYVIVFVRAEGSFYYYNLNDEEWQPVPGGGP